MIAIIVLITVCVMTALVSAWLVKAYWLELSYAEGSDLIVPLGGVAVSACILVWSSWMIWLACTS